MKCHYFLILYWGGGECVRHLSSPNRLLLRSRFFLCAKTFVGFNFTEFSGTRGKNDEFLQPGQNLVLTRELFVQNFDYSSKFIIRYAHCSFSFDNARASVVNFGHFCCIDDGDFLIAYFILHKRHVVYFLRMCCFLSS